MNRPKKYINKVLMIYDLKEFPIAQFDILQDASKFLNVKRETLKSVMSARDGKLRNYIIRWVNIED